MGRIAMEYNQSPDTAHTRSERSVPSRGKLLSMEQLLGVPGALGVSCSTAIWRAISMSIEIGDDPGALSPWERDGGVGRCWHWWPPESDWSSSWFGHVW